MHDLATAQKIAKAALHLLEENGPEAVTMRQVAKAVGITPMAIYHYFPSREALLKAITDAEFTKLNEFAEARVARGPADARIIHIMDGYLDYALARPKLFDYVFLRPRKGARRFPDDFRARRSPTLNPVADVIAKAMEDGVLKQDDVWEIALALWAHVHGYVALYRAERFNLTEQQFRRLVHRSTRRFLIGLKN
jgi:AcrR family transcriptional regulator